MDLYDQWKVEHSASNKDPTTNYKRKLTTFTSPFFEMKENRFETFLHEFAHLRQKNHALYPGDDAYIGAILSNRHGEVPSEIEAKDIARKLRRGTCICGEL